MAGAVNYECDNVDHIITNCPKLLQVRSECEINKTFYNLFLKSSKNMKTLQLLSMNINMEDQSHADNENVSRKNRLKMYRNILNYFRGRSFSLNFVLACKQPSVNIPPDMKTYENLCKDMQGLHYDITLIQSIKSSLNLISSSLASTELMSVNDFNSRRDCFNKIEGIIYFSKGIMKLYNDCCSELELLEKMKSYSTVLTEYMKSLERLKECERNESDEESKEMEKAELQIYKINLMRMMKSVLIGYISLNCPDMLRNVLSFKTSLRRDLTVDDFRDTWDVGLSS